MMQIYLFIYYYLVLDLTRQHRDSNSQKLSPHAYVHVFTHPKEFDMNMQLYKCILYMCLHTRERERERERVPHQILWGG